MITTNKINLKNLLQYIVFILNLFLFYILNYLFLVSDMLLRPDLAKATPIAPSGRTCSSSSSCSSYDAESPNSYASCSNSKAAMRDSTQRLLPCHNADISLPLLQYQTSCLQPTNQKRCTSMTSQLPASLDPETMVWSVVGSQGGRLTLPESG